MVDMSVLATAEAQDWSPQGVPSKLFMEYHEVGFSIAWSLLASIAAFLAMYSYRKYSFYSHAILGISIVSYTLGLTLPILIKYEMKFGYGDYNIVLKVGAWLGLMVLVLGCILGFSGIVARWMQEGKKSKSSTVILIKKFHRIIGYSAIFIGKVNVVLGWYPLHIFWFFLAWEIIFLGFLLYRKAFFPKLTDEIVDHQKKEETLVLYKDIKEIPQKLEYVIFSDFIYNIQTLKKYHPAGFQIVESVKGREIDRFIYGMYSSQILPSIQVHQHSFRSLELVGKPIGKIFIPPFFSPPLPELFDGLVKFKETISAKGEIYLIGIHPLDQSLSFLSKGYKDVRQLGQYYAININNKITRLYTSVHCLSSTNLQLLELLCCSSQEVTNYFKTKTTQTTLNSYEIMADSCQHFQAEQGESKPKTKNKIEFKTNNYLPLMIKKYKQGKLTNKLLADDWGGVVKVSGPKGLGLHLGGVNNGKIIIVAGGTGFFPFMDLVDLVFKEKLVFSDHELRRRIIKQNPILQSFTFSGFRFVLYLALNQPEDIHPISLYQLGELCKGNQFKATLRIKEREELVSKVYGSLKMTKSRFDKLLIEEAKLEPYQKIWICGPPIMNTETSKTLLANGFQQSDYIFI